MDPSLF